MARYGDIVEINGQFFEFTPVGYMPVSAPSTDGGMLTMPDDTITSSPTGDVIVKEEPTTTTQTGLLAHLPLTQLKLKQEKLGRLTLMLNLLLQPPLRSQRQSLHHLSLYKTQKNLHQNLKV